MSAEYSDASFKNEDKNIRFSTISMDSLLGQYPAPLPDYIPLFEPMRDVPLGLEPLIGIDAIHVQRQFELFDVLVDVKTKRRYNIMNDWGQRIYYAGEDAGFCSRKCFGKSRPFEINLFNGLGHVAITIERRCNPQLCFYGGQTTGSNVIVKSGFTGQIIGYVIQNCGCFTPAYLVVDESKNEIMRIVGPKCGSCYTSSYCFSSCCCCCHDLQFQIISLLDNPSELSLTGAGEGQDHVHGQDPGQDQGQDQGQIKAKSSGSGEWIGTITKRFGLQELVTEEKEASKHSAFGVSFPPDLHPSFKALLIGAIFCIDFSYLEKGSGSCSGLEFLLIFILVVVIGLVVFLKLFHDSGSKIYTG